MLVESIAFIAAVFCDHWRDPRRSRACMFAHAPAGRWKASQEAAALQLEIRLLRLGEWHGQRPALRLAALKSVERLILISRGH